MQGTTLGPILQALDNLGKLSFIRMLSRYLPVSIGFDKGFLVSCFLSVRRSYYNGFLKRYQFERYNNRCPFTSFQLKGGKNHEKCLFSVYEILSISALLFRFPIYALQKDPLIEICTITRS